MTDLPAVHKNMLIGEVVELFPEATDIMLSYGLHCVGCHANAFETLEQGMLGHGFRDEDLNSLIQELNDFVLDKHGPAKKREPASGSENMTLKVTEKAFKKIAEIAKKEEKHGWPLRISGRYSGPQKVTYSMNFDQDVHEYDKVFEFKNGQIKIVLDRLQYDRLNGIKVDFVKRKDTEGFRIEQPMSARI
ncbi:MAG: DUF1858 domain-containing protein [bacterium]|nr:DUF1858 domain-containing protein [bacterium]